jgi:hypothetical protein
LSLLAANRYFSIVEETLPTHLDYARDRDLDLDLQAHMPKQTIITAARELVP